MKITIKINTDHEAFFSANSNYEDVMDSIKKAVVGLINNERKYVNNIDIEGNYLDKGVLGSIEIECNKLVNPKKYLGSK